MDIFLAIMVVALLVAFVVLMRKHRRLNHKHRQLNQQYQTVSGWQKKAEEQRNEAHGRIKQLNVEKAGLIRKLRDGTKKAQLLKAQLDYEQEINGLARTQIASYEEELQKLHVQHQAALQFIHTGLKRVKNGTCDKLPLYTREDAEYWAREKSTQFGANLVPYKCMICPRYIVTGERIFHLGNAEPEFRTLARHAHGREHGSRTPPLPSSGVASPGDIARLRDKYTAPEVKHR